MSARLFVLVVFLSTLGLQAHAEAPAKVPAARPLPMAAPMAAIEQRLTTLAADVESLRALATEVPTLQQAVADALAELKVLKQEAEHLDKERQTLGEERARTDALESRLTRLSEELATLRATVQAELAPEARARAGGLLRYDDGFVLEADAGRFTLRTNAYVQLHYELRLREDPLLISETKDDSILAHVHDNHFALRRARLAWDGSLYGRALRYGVELELAQGVALTDAVVEGSLPWHLDLRAGRFKVPFARAFLVDERNLSFPELSIATEEFRYDRDLGIAVVWRPLGELFHATLGVFNGTPKSVGRDNEDPLLAVRLGSTPLGVPSARVEEGDFDNTRKMSLSLGVGFTFENAPVPGLTKIDVDHDDVHDNVRVVQASADVTFRWRRLGIEAEGYLRREAWGAAARTEGVRDTYLGGFVQASYFVLPQRFQVGARASHTHLSSLVLADKPRLDPPSDTAYELGAIAAYYRHRRNVALQGMYTYRDFGDVPGKGEHRVIVQSQIAF